MQKLAIWTKFSLTRVGEIFSNLQKPNFEPKNDDFHYGIPKLKMTVKLAFIIYNSLFAHYIQKLLTFCIKISFMFIYNS